MTEFKAGTEPSSGKTKEQEGEEGNKPSSKGSKVKHLIPKSRHQSIDGESNSAKKAGRRNRSSDPTADSSNNDSSGGSRHRRRRGSNHGSESPTQDMPPTSAKPRRKTKMGTSEDSPVKKPTQRTRRASKGDSLSDISLSQELTSSPN
ncbi:WD40 repeat protein [Stylosanthes scabra]|uniref:WD40 repeat protein n=1 Tax=Stylosanthes scabra TaxID=79078 RepID=A0ABU6RHK6_9FABA|nr:WD40 repeat protein [Stylosanthes scabra]